MLGATVGGIGPAGSIHAPAARTDAVTVGAAICRTFFCLHASCWRFVKRPYGQRRTLYLFQFSGETRAPAPAARTDAVTVGAAICRPFFCLHAVSAGG